MRLRGRRIGWDFGYGRGASTHGRGWVMRRRPEIFTIRLTAEERALIDAAAGVRRLASSAWAREVLLRESRPRTAAEIVAEHRALRGGG